jgi:hypothetical protein
MGNFYRASGKFYLTQGKIYLGIVILVMSVNPER